MFWNRRNKQEQPTSIRVFLCYSFPDEPVKRKVIQRGDAFYARHYSHQRAIRLLPYGKVKTDICYIARWEPCSPPEWQPCAETAHEKIQRLERECTQKAHAEAVHKMEVSHARGLLRQALEALK